MSEAPQASPMMAMMSPAFLENPYLFYEMLRGMGPVPSVPGILGIGGRVITSVTLAQQVLRGKAFGIEAERVLPPEKLALIPQQNPNLAERRKNNMLFRDPPVHTRLRGLVNQAFTPRTVERLRDHIADIAEHLIDAVKDRGRMDLIADFAVPLPVIVIAELLGAPPEDRDRIKAMSTDLTLSLNPAVTPAEIKRTEQAIVDFDDYFTPLIEARRRDPRPDLISDLVRVHEAGDRLSMDELLATCRLILTAGHETTVNLIGNGTLALLRHPAERAALAADPSLLPNAVEELLRYDSPVQMTMRFAMEPAVLAGENIAVGELLVVVLGAANRDPAVFADPARLDIKRDNAREHMSFGAGVHYCLGAPLARLEGQIAFGALLRRLPGLALAVERPQWRAHPSLRGVLSLPVTF